MAVSQSTSSWPLLVTGGAVAAGALWWLSARRANAASLVRPGAAPTSADAQPQAALPAPSASAEAGKEQAISSRVAPATTSSTLTSTDIVGRLPFVPPAIVAAVAATTSARGPGPAPASAAPPTVAPPATTPAPTAEPSTAGWVWPLLRWRDYAPVISDGWGSPRDGGRRTHRGADLMYRRRSPADQLASFPARAPHSAWHFLPPGTIAVAARDGEVWSAGRTSRGYAVVLTHAEGWVTYYQHLAQLFIPALDHGTGKIRVRAGQALGIVGADPTQPNQIAHLHFELRRGTRPIDPRGALQSWRCSIGPPSFPRSRRS